MFYSFFKRRELRHFFFFRACLPELAVDRKKKYVVFNLDIKNVLNKYLALLFRLQFFYT